MDVVSFGISWLPIVGVLCVFLMVRGKKQKTKKGGGSDGSDSGSSDYSYSGSSESCGSDSGGDCGGVTAAAIRA